MKNRIIALGLMVSMALTAFVPSMARAGENQAKAVAIGATVLSAYLLSHRNTRKAGYVGAAGSVYLWKKYADSRKARRRREIARENYYRRAAYHNARAARYYRSRYYATRGGGRSYRSARYARYARR